MWKKLFLFFVSALVTASLFAQTGVIESPETIVSTGNIEALAAAITLIITYFSGVIPGLKNVKSGVIRAVAVGLVVVVAVVQFRFGWLGQESVTAILAILAPTFAYSGFAWEIIKALLGLFKVDVKATMPGAGNVK